MSIVYAGLALSEICVLFASAIGILVLAVRWTARWIIGDLSAEIPVMKQKNAAQGFEQASASYANWRCSAHRLG